MRQMPIEQTELARLRTAEVFGRPFTELVGTHQHPGLLVGRLVMLASELTRPLAVRRRVELLGLEGWKKAENTRQYRPVTEMDPATLWITSVQGHKLALIAALELDEGGQLSRGACIKLNGNAKSGRVVRLHDIGNRSFVPAESNREIPDYLGLERQSRGRLMFLDASPILYYVSSAERVVESSADRLIIDPADADEQMARILGNAF